MYFLINILYVFCIYSVSCVMQMSHLYIYMQSLSNIGMELGALQSIEVDDNGLMKWKTPTIPHNIKSLFIDDDNKDNDQISIGYRILYQATSQNPGQEEKKDDEWNEVELAVHGNSYDMSGYAPCQAKVQYVINNILCSALSSTVWVECKYIAEWSSECIGNKIKLTENGTKAMTGGKSESVRAKNPISKGMYVKLNYVCGGGGKGCEIIGVISSEYNDRFDREPRGNGIIRKYCYGADCFYDSGCSNKHYYDGEYKDLGWSLGKKTNEKSITIQMIIDYKTYDTCCLSFYIDGQFKGPKDAKYSMKLPKLKDDHVWYPITSFRYNHLWCKIVCVD